jgi:hypothetical protein
MADKLYFARDFKPRGHRSGPRCWFLTAETLDEAKAHMERYVAAERQDDPPWFGPSSLRRGYLSTVNGEEPYRMTHQEIADALAKPVALLDQHEAAAWVSRIENRPTIYDETNNVWTVVVGEEEWNRLIEPDAELSVESGMRVNEISIEAGFRQEEIDIGWKRALYSRLSAE